MARPVSIRGNRDEAIKSFHYELVACNVYGLSSTVCSTLSKLHCAQGRNRGGGKSDSSSNDPAHSTERAEAPATTIAEGIYFDSSAVWTVAWSSVGMVSNTPNSSVRTSIILQGGSYPVSPCCCNVRRINILQASGVCVGRCAVCGPRRGERARPLRPRYLARDAPARFPMITADFSQFTVHSMIWKESFREQAKKTRTSKVNHTPEAPSSAPNHQGKDLSTIILC
eukprot:6202569-Pleurochrysis_carterae.AAC.1